jgi:hypothetical protein
LRTSMPDRVAVLAEDSKPNNSVTRDNRAYRV